MKFKPFDQVICVDDEDLPADSTLVKGGVYTVTDANADYVTLGGLAPVLAERLILAPGKESRHDPRLLKGLDVIEDRRAPGKESPKAGDRFNSGKVRWRNFPLFLLEDLMKVASAGEEKYSTFNFLKGSYVNDGLDSLKRHLMKLESPYHADEDEDSKINHAYHIAWNALVIGYMLKHRPDLDDRVKLKDFSDEK